MRLIYIPILLLGLSTFPLFGQDISLYQQYNGRIDYTAIGNTLNPFENNLDGSFCNILPSSEAELNLSPTATIVAAYLYWAGSGEGDLEVSLNGTSITAEELYHVDYEDPFNGTLRYFSCFSEITDLVNTFGNTTYLFEDFDISETLASIPGYCNNRTNFGGWSIYIIYEEDTLPINQVSLFQGLEIINRVVQEKIIIIDNINVLDDNGAKIGFLAWEGDSILNFGETLQINGNILSNPPLNPSDNAFNGTNSFTGSNTFYNGDLDVYDIEDNIDIGDTSVEIKLTTGDFDSSGVLRADLIILNNIITVLNSQLPDATIVVDEFFVPCFTRLVELDYSVFNSNSTEVLPANTPIAFYVDDILIAQSETQSSIPIDGSEPGNIILNIPEGIPELFDLTIVVDDIGDGSGIVIELNETNNTTVATIELFPLPEIVTLPELLNCDIGFNTAFFDLTTQIEFIEDYDSNDTIVFFETLDDLLNNEDPILDPVTYQNSSDPQTIFVKQDRDICSFIYQFNLTTENCPPFIPQGFSPNNDGYNDWFNIQGLYDIFENHELQIYNRYGTLIFVGNNDKRWEGRANRGLSNQGNLLPVGTYFYVLNLNDDKFDIMTGWVYLNK